MTGGKCVGGRIIVGARGGWRGQMTGGKGVGAGSRGREGVVQCGVTNVGAA